MAEEEKKSAEVSAESSEKKSREESKIIRNTSWSLTEIKEKRTHSYNEWPHKEWSKDENER